MNRFVLIALFAGLSVSARAQEFDPTNHAMVARWAEIQSAAWPLQTANADLCKGYSAYLPGFTVFAASNGVGPQVLQVANGSPAAAAGLQPGDSIVAVNGAETDHRKPDKSLEQFDEALAEAIESPAPIRISFVRDGLTSELSLTPVPACDIRIAYNGAPVPTFTQDNLIMLGNQMDLYVQDDAQTRLFLARELASMFLAQKGVRQKSANKFGWLAHGASLFTGHDASAAAGLWANMRHGDKQDLDADRLGLYLAARTGDDIAGAPAFWESVFARRTGPKALGRILGNSPGSPERLEGIRTTTAEILAKAQAGAPLVPDAKLATASN